MGSETCPQTCGFGPARFTESAVLEFDRSVGVALTASFSHSEQVSSFCLSLLANHFSYLQIPGQLSWLSYGGDPTCVAHNP